MELLHVIVRCERVTALVAPSRATPLDLADRVLELCDGGIVEH
jgi:putative ABC transport system ATP-binding protein